MTDYHIIGAENSPYSIKVRSYFRYKDIPHQWLDRQRTDGDDDRSAPPAAAPTRATGGGIPAGAEAVYPRRRKVVPR